MSKYLNHFGYLRKFSYLERNATKIFKLAGGVGKDNKITLRAFRAALPTHPKNHEFTYTAPDVTGPNTIIITDVNGAEVKVDIEISSDNFFISPSSAMMLRGEKRLFRLVGGAGEDFTWTTLVCGLTKDDTNKRYIGFLAPGQTGDNTLTATDISGKNTESDVYIYSDNLLITPKHVFMKPGEQTTLRAVFGTGEYEFSYTDGTIAADETSPSDRILYTAPKKSGEYFVTVYDSAGNTSKANITVPAIDPPDKANDETEWLVMDPDAIKLLPVQGGQVSPGAKVDFDLDFPHYTGTGVNIFLLIMKPCGELFWIDSSHSLIDIATGLPIFAKERTDAVEDKISLDNMPGTWWVGYMLQSAENPAATEIKFYPFDIQ